MDSKEITDAITEVGDSNSDSPLVRIGRSTDNSVDASFINGVSVTVTQSELSFDILGFVLMVPPHLHKMASGLLGNFNDEREDDFMYPDGTLLDMDPHDEQIHNFGQSCELLLLYILCTVGITNKDACMQLLSLFHHDDGHSMLAETD